MVIAEIIEALWREEGHLLCGEDGCGVHDGTVAPCEWCNKFVCIEHDDVLANRDIDSGLMLCQPCGYEYDKEHHIVYTDNGEIMVVESEMKCEPCVKECKAQGQLCSPKDPDHASYYEQWMYEQDDEHRRVAHVMVLTGGSYRCGKGHVVEAHPADAMRAAGQQPML